MSTVRRFAAIWCLTCLVFGQVAQAKGLIVVDNTYASNTVGQFISPLTEYKSRNDLQRLLERLGGTYVVAPASVTKTEFCRTGRMVWNYGEQGAYVETFDWVAHVSFNGKFTTNVSGYRPDSLTLSVDRDGDSKADGCTVPQLFIFGQMGNLHAPANRYAFARDSTVDSCGIVVSAGGSDVQHNGNNPCFTGLGGYQEGTSDFFWSPSMHSGFKLNPTPPAGGLRILTRSTGDFGARTYMSDQLNSPRPDSIGTRTGGSDSSDVFVRLWSHITGAKEQTFCYPYWGSECTDSSSRVLACEYDPQTILMALAHIDSTTGGRVFDRLKPLKAALVISGAFRRSGPRNAGGIAPNDTTSLKAGLDSLATLGLPVTVGVCPDSIESRPSEVGWWKKLGGARFAVEQAAGDSGAVLSGGGNFSLAHPFDPFGKRRVRAAYGDSVRHAVDGSDSSTCAALVASRNQMAPYFSGRISGAVIPLSFDWSPLQANSSSQWNPDSTLLAVSRAGFSVLVFDGQVPQGRTNPVGVVGLMRQRRWVKYDAGTNAVRSVALLAHSGFSINGSARQIQVTTDSIGSGLEPCQNVVARPNRIVYEHHRFIHQLLWDQYRDYDFMRYDESNAWIGVNTPLNDALYAINRGSILMTHVQDFAGGEPLHVSSGDPNTFAAFWTVKSLNNAFKTINRLAGRTIATFAYPEDIEP